jgi:hypothetical protein
MAAGSEIKKKAQMAAGSEIKKKKAHICTVRTESIIFRRVRKITKSCYYLCDVCLRPSARNNAAPTGRMFIKFDN